jgi:Fe-S cluster biogenesis protein NfuA
LFLLRRSLVVVVVFGADLELQLQRVEALMTRRILAVLGDAVDLLAANRADAAVGVHLEGGMQACGTEEMTCHQERQWEYSAMLVGGCGDK